MQLASPLSTVVFSTWEIINHKQHLSNSLEDFPGCTLQGILLAQYSIGHTHVVSFVF